MENVEKILIDEENEAHLFGHPKGLFYLFFAELWERFSFYGMRALLTLYMVQDLFSRMQDGEAKEKAFGIYAAYGALVYATPVIGGMVADKFIGYRKSIMLGGVLMALGHFVLAVEHPVFFYSALALLIVGNGFFKPNISTMVGSLYKEGDPKRDAGFTIFYMGINVGAWAAPLLCGWLGASYGWHYGFGLAGIGMITGLIFFWSGMRSNVFGNRGLQPAEYATAKFSGMNIANWFYIGSFLSVPLFALMVYWNDFQLLEMSLMSLLMWGVLGAILIYLVYICFNVTKIERERLAVVVILTFFITIFWSFFEQAGSSLTLFAEENVNLVFLNAAQTNSINPGYIILLAIPFSTMWVFLSRMKANPYTPVKFAMGIAQLGLGFLVFAYSAQFMDAAGRVPFAFLMIGYFFITTGELFISPIGLSKVTELSPVKITGFMMGVYFLSSAFAHHIAGAIAKLTTTPVARESDIAPEGEGGFMTSIIEWVTGFTNGTTDSAVTGVQTLANYTSVFTQIGIIALAFALLAFLLTPLLRKWMHGVH